MSAPISSSSVYSSKAKFFIITRHVKTAQLLQRYGGKLVNSIDEVPPSSLVIGVLPLDLIALLNSKGSKFIYVAINPVAYQQKFNVPYNPKTAETMIANLTDDEFVKILSFTLYEKVTVMPVSVTDILNECANADAVYYVGSKAFAEGLAKLCNKPVVSSISGNQRVVPFTPIDGRGYYLKVANRDLVVNNADEFVSAITSGTIKIYRAESVMRQLTWQEVLSILSSSNDMQEDPKGIIITKEV